MISLDLSEKLKEFRKQTRLDQFEMAELVGVSHRTYQDIEKTGEVKKAKDLKSINDILEGAAQKDAHLEDGDIDTAKEFTKAKSDLYSGKYSALDIIAKMLDHSDRIVKNNEKLVSNNEKLVTNNEKLLDRLLSSDKSDEASSVSKEKEKSSKKPFVELQGKSDNDSEKSPRKRKDTLKS